MKFTILRPNGPFRMPEGDPGIAMPDCEPWFILVDAAAGFEIDERLCKPEFYGWIHHAQESPESPGSVINRAKRNPGRVSVVGGSLPGVVRRFMSAMAEEDAELFVSLERFDNPGMTILGEMMHRAPYNCGAHILRYRLPDYAGFQHGDEYLSLSSVLLFVAVPFGSRSCVMMWRSPAEKAGFAELLRSSGLHSETRIRQALFTVGVAFWMNEFGMDFPEAVCVAGGGSHAHATKLIRRVLGVDSPRDAGRMTLEETIQLADRYILRHPERASPLPPLPLPATLLTQRTRRMADLSQREAAKVGAVEWLDGDLTQRVIERWMPDVTTLVARYFVRGEGLSDAVMLVFEKACQKWVEHQVFDSELGIHRLTISERDQFGSLFQICKNECRNLAEKKDTADSPLISLDDVVGSNPAHSRLPNGPLRDLEAAGTLDAIQEAIAGMPGGRADIARARFIDGPDQ